jgi:UDP-GlcNAc:undecaprenyl-phosphate GlcNAc-1-phosphate transferase
VTVAAVRAALLAALVVLMSAPVRRWFHANDLLWLYLAGSACTIALLTVPVVRAYARWRGVLDHPSGRKVHATPTPLLGGAAVYAAFAVIVLVNFNFSRELKGVALGATVVVLAGIADDISDLPAWVKLLAQIAGAAVAIAFGAVLTVVPHGLPAAGALNVVLTVLWMLVVTNAVQFLDGMDGLAAGIGAITGIFFSVVALQTAQPYLMFLSAPLVGACVGFLPYNLRPRGATIFLGDSGASFIGFLLAGLAVMGVWADRDPLIALLTPVLLLAVPLFDIAFVGVVRIVQGRVHSFHEWLAYTGKDHLHHRFEALGFTKTESVLLIFFICVTLGISAMLLNGAPRREAMLILVQVASVLAIVALLEGMGRGRPG